MLQECVLRDLRCILFCEKVKGLCKKVKGLLEFSLSKF